MITYKEMIKRNEIFCFNSDNYISMKKVLAKAESLVEEDDVELFYMKNMFLRDKEAELFLFCRDNRIFKISIDDGFIITTLFKKNNIIKVEIKERYRSTKEKVLEIRFKDNEVFLFDSSNDTNEDYESDLASNIEYIFKSLSMSKA